MTSLIQTLTKSHQREIGGNELGTARHAMAGKEEDATSTILLMMKEFAQQELASALSRE